jgi:hypothetical protein
MADKAAWLEPYRFKPGHRLSVGHAKPHATEVQLLRKAMITCMSPDDMAQMTRRLVEIVKTAKPKDAVEAWNALTDRLFGKAKESIEVSQSEPNAHALAMYDEAQLRQMIDILDNPSLPQQDKEILIEQDSAVPKQEGVQTVVQGDTGDSST